MKWVFKNQYEMVPKQGFSFFGPLYVEICTGGSFLPVEEDQPMYELTDREVVNKLKDQQFNCMNYLSGFFGGEYAKADSGYIGQWDDDISKDGKVYYFVQDGIVHKMIICEYDGMTMTNVTGHQYIMEYNGQALDCIPEEGDIIYDNIQEAENEMKR